MKYFKNITEIAIGLLCVLSTQSWGVIEFSGAENFRDVNVNIPLTYSQSSADQFILGINVVDSDTLTVPAGAIVRAKNLVSEEEFVLPRSGGIGYFALIPYTTERATGEWIVEVNSDVGSASALIPAFGTGPGTGQVPFVDDLVVTLAGAQPSFTWTLPSNLHDQNDDNVDRLRARIIDSSNARIIDDRFDPTATATNYTTSQGFITHNGAYIAQIMIEGFEPYNRSRNSATFLVEDVGVGGVPSTLDNIFHARDFRGANSVGRGTGDRQIVCIDAHPFVDTYVYAEQSGEVLQSDPSGDNPQEFCSGFTFNPALTGAWNVIAWNGAQKTSVQTYALGSLDQLPLITNIRIAPDNLTPTIHWDLPAGNTVPYDEIFIGLFDDVTDIRLARFGSSHNERFDSIGINETSYKFPAGVLEEGGRYVVRVMLVDQDGDNNQINRSTTFLNFTPIMESGVGEIFLPTLDEGGIYNFEFDVTMAVSVTIDPEVAVGYTYEIGAGDPRFATVELPFEGDGLYSLSVFNDMGDLIHSFQVHALVPFNFLSFEPTGISKFEVRGIEIDAGLDPLNATAFRTTLTFASSGTFTGSMTPIVQSSADSDGDGDGVADTNDLVCPNSDLTPTVVIYGCDSGVLNPVYINGCTIMDEINTCTTGTRGELSSCVSHVTNNLKKSGLISGKQKGSIQKCAKLL